MKNLLIIGISLSFLFLVFRFAASNFDNNFFEIFNVFAIEDKKKYTKDFTVGANYISNYSRRVDKFSSTSSQKSSSRSGWTSSDQNSNFHVNYATNGLGYSGLREEQVNVFGSYSLPINTGYSNSRSNNRQLGNNQPSTFDTESLDKMLQSIYKKRSDEQDANIKSNTSSVFAMSTNDNLFISRQNIGGPEDDGDPIVPEDTIPVGEGTGTFLIMIVLYIAFKAKSLHKIY